MSVSYNQVRVRGGKEAKLERMVEKFRGSFGVDVKQYPKRSMRARCAMMTRWSSSTLKHFRLVSQKKVRIPLKAPKP